MFVFLKCLLLQTFAHELGHSLGMPHDFTDTTTTPRLDSNGQSCLTVDGIMSYKVKPECHLKKCYRAKNQGMNNDDCIDGLWQKFQNVAKTTWSQCSKEAITGWFGQLYTYGLNCKGGCNTI